MSAKATTALAERLNAAMYAGPDRSRMERATFTGNYGNRGGKYKPAPESWRALRYQLDYIIEHGITGDALRRQAADLIAAESHGVQPVGMVPA